MLSFAAGPIVKKDWERGTNNTIPCFLQLCGNVTTAMRARGKKLAISIDDSKGDRFNDSATAWAYEWDWLHFVPFADELTNMGTCTGPIPVRKPLLLLDREESFLICSLQMYVGPKEYYFRHPSSSNPIASSTPAQPRWAAWKARSKM